MVKSKSQFSAVHMWFSFRCGHQETPMQLFTFVYPVFRSENCFRCFMVLSKLNMSAMSSNKELKEPPILARTHWYCEEFSLENLLNLFWPPFCTGPRWFQAWCYHIANHWAIMTLEDILIFCIFEIKSEIDGTGAKLFDSLVTVAQSPGPSREMVTCYSC